MNDLRNGVSRRTLLQAGAGLAGAVVLPGGVIMPAYGAGEPAMGTWPAGSQSSTVTVSPCTSPCTTRSNARCAVRRGRYANELS